MMGLAGLHGTAMEDRPCIYGMRWVYTKMRISGRGILPVLQAQIVDAADPANLRAVTPTSVRNELLRELRRAEGRVGRETRGRTKTVLTELLADLKDHVKAFEGRMRGSVLLYPKDEVQRANFTLASIQNIDRMIEVEMPREEVTVAEEEALRPILDEEQEARQRESGFLIGAAIGGVVIGAFGLIAWLK